MEMKEIPVHLWTGCFLVISVQDNKRMTIAGYATGQTMGYYIRAEYKNGVARVQHTGGGVKNGMLANILIQFKFNIQVFECRTLYV